MKKTKKQGCRLVPVETVLQGYAALIDFYGKTLKEHDIKAFLCYFSFDVLRRRLILCYKPVSVLPLSAAVSCLNHKIAAKIIVVFEIL